jgi:osmotically-inducible protein OsmY
MRAAFRIVESARKEGEFILEMSTIRSTGARKAKRQPAGSPRTSPADPRILLAGKEFEELEAVESVLQELAVQVRRVESLDDAMVALDEQPIAAVLVAPLPEHALSSAVATLRDTTGPTWPIFAVVPAGTPHVQSRRLYRKGATLVFEWPREALLLPRVALEMLEVEPRRSPATSEDLRLERALRARLALVPGACKRLRVQVRGGTAILAGEVYTLWKKRRIEEFAEQMPGVASVIARGLSVLPSGLGDREIARNIRALLRGAVSVEEQTLAVSVNDGHVVLTGTVSSMDELERLQQLLGNVYGVRSLTDRTDRAPSKKRRDQAVARRLQSTLSHLSRSADVRVAVTQGVAVLTGCVDRLDEKRAIVSHISRDESIERVASKIEVSVLTGDEG